MTYVSANNADELYLPVDRLIDRAILVRELLGKLTSVDNTSRVEDSQALTNEMRNLYDAWNELQKERISQGLVF